MVVNMENFDTDNIDYSKADDVEKCFSCGMEFREGQGRFRKPKGVFCLGCCPDNNAESSPGRSSLPEDAG